MSEWIDGLVSEWGALGVLILMALETIFPPIPSEVVLPLAGRAAANGEISLLGALVGGTIGAILGTLPFYLAARWYGIDKLKRFAGRYGRWITLTPGDIDRADAWFERNGWLAVLVGRMVPGLRSLISVPAGFAEMDLTWFMIYTAIGTFAWSAILIAIGYGLGQQSSAVEQWLGTVGDVILVAALALYVYRLVTFVPEREPGATRK